MLKTVHGFVQDLPLRDSDQQLAPRRRGVQIAMLDLADYINDSASCKVYCAMFMKCRTRYRLFRCPEFQKLIHRKLVFCIRNYHASSAMFLHGFLAEDLVQAFAITVRHWELKAPQE